LGNQQLFESKLGMVRNGKLQGKKDIENPSGMKRLGRIRFFSICQGQM
jgi:hypothetical protein